jgi:DNA polymerase III alpha subunit
MASWTVGQWLRLSLEYENGMINVIVRPKVYAKHQAVLRSSRLLIVEDEVQRKDNVINILLQRAASADQRCAPTT